MRVDVDHIMYKPAGSEWRYYIVAASRYVDGQWSEVSGWCKLAARHIEDGRERLLDDDERRRIESQFASDVAGDIGLMASVLERLELQRQCRLYLPPAVPGYRRSLYSALCPPDSCESLDRAGERIELENLAAIDPQGGFRP